VGSGCLSSSKRAAQLHRAQARLQSQVDRLTDAYLNQVMTLEEYQRRRQAVEHQLQAMARQGDQLAAEARRQQDLGGVVQSIEAFCSRVQGGLSQATWEQKRQLVELLIDRVVVTDADVEIHYVIPTTPASEQVRFCHLRTDYFDCRLGFVRRDEFLVGELLGVKHVGGHDERRSAQRLLLERCRITGEGDLDVPLLRRRGRLGTGTAHAAVLGDDHDTCGRAQPRGLLAQFPLDGCLRIGFTGKGAIA
jgi:hypothetical protein